MHTGTAVQITHRTSGLLFKAVINTSQVEEGKHPGNILNACFII